MADPFVQKFKELTMQRSFTFRTREATPPTWVGSNEEVDPGSREDVNEGGATSEFYQSFACHDGGNDMSGNRCISK